MSVDKAAIGRSSLDPRLADAIRRGLDPKQDEGLVAADYLESHDPRFAGPISDKIRRVVDDALYRAVPWQSLNSPFDAARIVTDATIKSQLFVLVLTTSGRGYIREAAVHRIECIPCAFSLALLVNRLNDWVPNVRRAAEERLSALSPRLDRQVLADCIEFLWHFDEYGRASDAGRQIVAALVEGEATVACLRDRVLRTADDRVFRLVQHMLRSAALDDMLVSLATQHRHPRVRAIAAKAALEGAFSWRKRTLRKRPVDVQVDRATLALSLLKDRSAEVQYHALQHLSQSMIDETRLDAILKRYLVHPRRKLSDLAQWRLNKRGVDWLGWLRQEFDRRPLDVALARLLARVGAASDAERLWSSAQQASDKTRSVFVLAAARLKLADAVRAAQAIALHDPSIGYARAAAAALLDAQEFIPTDELLEAARTPDMFVRRGLLAHVHRRTVLEQVGIVCRLEAAGRVPDANQLSRLTRRLNRGKLDLTAAQKEELKELSGRSPRMAAWMRQLQLT